MLAPTLSLADASQYACFGNRCSTRLSAPELVRQSRRASTLASSGKWIDHPPVP